MEIDFVPKCLLARLPGPSTSHIHLSIFLSNVSAVVLLSALTRVPHICLLRFFFHVPCPGCGVTHAILRTAHFHLAAAWHSNPAGLGVVAGFCYQLIARPIAMLFPQTGESVVRTSRLLSKFVVVGLFAVWIWRLTQGEAKNVNRVLPKMQQLEYQIRLSGVDNYRKYLLFSDRHAGAAGRQKAYPV